MMFLNTNTISTISNEEFQKAFTQTTRQYTVGHLSNKQIIPHYDDDRIEIGITQYSEYAIEPSHYHTNNTEYEYVIYGETKYMDIETGTVYHFVEGDFYCIPPYIKYAQKSLRGTKILFVKCPAGNDKHTLSSSEMLLTWYEVWEK